MCLWQRGQYFFSSTRACVFLRFFSVVYVRSLHSVHCNVTTIRLAFFALAMLHLFDNLADDAGAHSAATLTDREVGTDLQRHRHNQLDGQVHVVARHHHLDPARQLRFTRHVHRPHVELRPVPVEERRVAPALFLLQHVHRTLERHVRLDRPRLCQHLPALHVLALDPAQQTPHVVPRNPFLQDLAKHLYPGHHRLARVPQPDDLHFLADLHYPTLDPPRHHRPSPLDPKHVLDRHQERLVRLAHRRRNVAVHRIHQRPDALVFRRTRILRRRLQRIQRTAADNRYLVPGELVARQQLAQLQLHQLQQLLVLHHFHFVQKHHHRRHFHLPRQQHVLARLRHRPVRRRRLVLHVRYRNRDPARLLFRRIVDRIKRPEIRPALHRQDLRDRRRQRRLAVVNMPNRPHVHMGLRAFKYCFRHADLALLLDGCP